MLFSTTDTATTEIYTLSLHDALPILSGVSSSSSSARARASWVRGPPRANSALTSPSRASARSRRCSPWARSEEHTSELQSLTNLVCRLLLEKKKKRHKLELVLGLSSR